MGTALQSPGEKIFSFFNIVILALVSFIMLYPLWHVLSVSFSSQTEVLKGGLFWLPKQFTIEAYHKLFSSDFIWIAYRNSIIVTVLGTFLSVFVTATTAYPLTQEKMPMKNLVSMLILFTMIFNGGIIPFYLIVKMTGLLNTLWALFIPTLVSAFNVFLMLSFFRSLPAELEESATIDGANTLRIFFSIILPLSKPIIATIALFEGVGYWNNFFHPLIFLSDKDWYTLPLLLKDIIAGQAYAELSGEHSDSATESVVSATIIATLVPILMSYPYLQRFFVKGVMLGSIKS